MTAQGILRSKIVIYLVSGVVVGTGLIIAATFWTFSECGPFTSGRIGDVEKDQAYTLVPPQVKLTYEGKESCTHSTSVVSTVAAGVSRTYELNGASTGAVRSFYKSELLKQGWKYESTPDDIGTDSDFHDFYSKKINDSGKELRLTINSGISKSKNHYTEDIVVFAP